MRIASSQAALRRAAGTFTEPASDKKSAVLAYRPVAFDAEHYSVALFDPERLAHGLRYGHLTLRDGFGPLTAADAPDPGTQAALLARRVRAGRLLDYDPNGSEWALDTASATSSARSRRSSPPC